MRAKRELKRFLKHNDSMYFTHGDLCRFVELRHGGPLPLLIDRIVSLPAVKCNRFGLDKWYKAELPKKDWPVIAYLTLVVLGCVYALAYPYLPVWWLSL